LRRKRKKKKKKSFELHSGVFVRSWCFSVTGGARGKKGKKGRGDARRGGSAHPTALRSFAFLRKVSPTGKGPIPYPSCLEGWYPLPGSRQEKERKGGGGVVVDHNDDTLEKRFKRRNITFCDRLKEEKRREKKP